MPPREQPMVPRATPESYYGRPILKEPVWKWPIPAYLFTGGLAGGSALLAAGSRLTRNRRLARQSRLVALGALGLSTGFLIRDLGRPSRFANMLRVFKPTSPMNVGSWILSAFGAALGVGVAADSLALPAAGALADGAAACLGPAVATYTAVLLADTAVPAWQAAGDDLPLLFAAGAAASAGALGVFLAPAQDAGAARRLLLGGAVAEILSAQRLRRRLEPDVARAYHEGRAGALGRASTACTVAGAAAVVTGSFEKLGAVAVATGAALERFAVVEAGRASARDPEATVGPQRRRMASAAAGGDGGRPAMSPRDGSRGAAPR
ncbi:MAG TPA: NrfD/PsrC family molybdoenzyme membrane anchor subunit [Actinomycetota bacterium]|nr:NrfD/PsrC family molybdoenzyme membrane anchor subunit [Actinomycetota bacterium]